MQNHFSGVIGDFQRYFPRRTFFCVTDQRKGQGDFFIKGIHIAGSFRQIQNQHFPGSGDPFQGLGTFIQHKTVKIHSGFLIAVIRGIEFFPVCVEGVGEAFPSGGKFDRIFHPAAQYCRPAVGDRIDCDISGLPFPVRFGIIGKSISSFGKTLRFDRHSGPLFENPDGTFTFISPGSIILPVGLIGERIGVGSTGHGAVFLFHIGISGQQIDGRSPQQSCSAEKKRTGCSIEKILHKKPPD